MILYSLLDRALPRSFLAKVLAVVVLLGQGPMLAVVALYGAGLLSAPLATPAVAAAFGVGLFGTALGLAAILRPVARLEATLAAFERGEAPRLSLPETHGDEVGRLMARAATLIRTTERRIDAAERQADRDPLTGLLNRRGFERALAARRGMRERGALLMLDLDHFKAVNDTHGHDEGDRVLREAASLLCEHMRRPDLAARFGGEEFVVYLSGIGREPALQVAERMRMAVEDRIAVAGRPQTASFGVAQWPVAVPFSEVLKRADAAVYEAKSQGRNCVRFAHVAAARDRVTPARVTLPGAGPSTAERATEDGSTDPEAAPRWRPGQTRGIGEAPDTAREDAPAASPQGGDAAGRDRMMRGAA
ncbi:GGDEF domain-containing protein [Rhodovulum sp. 12E13]|uniref:GGDEF domain-containing protein n=1 Tax=Rhodovulum sp. 12E13 TaxID=2203891 RepID=UPI001313EE2E|nr:GGDEF domain-containing protein [Rhodovulum sp. 12E13]